MTALLAGIAMLAQQERPTFKEVTFPRGPSKTVSTFLRVDLAPLEPSRFSPKKFGVPPTPWEFPWLTRGYAQPKSVPEGWLRFRIYSQDRKEKNDTAERVGQMLLALFEQSVTHLKRDHSEKYNFRIVDVFLCWGGKPGGEQRFDVINVKGEVIPINTIYFYDLPSFTDPVETAREVAHEYGHAVLPAIGGYEAPEGWANGYLGEKLFLTYLSEGMGMGLCTPDDAMGATKTDLDRWLAKNVQPLVTQASQTLPTPLLLADRSAAGMDRYIGLAMYAATVLPDAVFRRSLLLTGSTEAKDYPEAIALAAEEPEEFTLRIPSYLKGKTLWVPLNKGKVAGAKVLRYMGKWAKVQPTSDEVVVQNRRA